MKKKNFIIILAFVIVIYLARVIYVDLSMDYRQWNKELNINGKDGLHIDSSYISDNEIKLYIECDSYKGGYESLSEIVDIHNRFVEQNPDYFPSGYKISFEAIHPSGLTLMCYSNADPLFSVDVNLDTPKLEYCYVDIYEIIKAMNNSDLELNVPALVLTDSNSGQISSEAYSFVGRIHGLKKVIIDYKHDHGEIADIYKVITSNVPSVKVYQKSLNELKEYVN